MSDEFRLGPWLVQPSQNTISIHGNTTRLEPKMVEVLVCLAENPGETVSKEQLIRKVWGDTFVTDDVLIRSISELRKALEDDPKAPRVIETIPKKGYRLLEKVERAEPVQLSRQEIEDLKIPIAYGLRSGHVSRANITLPFGVRARLTVEQDAARLAIMEPAVSL